MVEDLDVTGWQVLDAEVLGTKPRKRWLLDPAGRGWLFKPVTWQQQGELAFPKGEDWAEKVPGDLARQLGFPSARVELAHLDEERGVVSLDVREHRDLVHGNEVLTGREPCRGW